MKIEINKIPEDGYWLDSEEPVGNYHLAYPLCQFLSPIFFHFFVNKVSHELLVQGDFRTKVEIQCSRCLKNFTYPLRFLEFTFCEEIAERVVIDLSNNIREDILMSIPSKPLCRENCRGLCPRCGQDLNVKECGCKKSRSDISFNDLNKLKFD